MKKFNFKLISAVIISAVVMFASCQSANVEIPEELTFAQLIQKGQDAAAIEKYAMADKYFVACIDRYGSDLRYYVEARYELATSNFKQKKYAMAKTMFNEIIDIFDKPESLYQVQPKYKKLANLQLEKIAKIEEENEAKGISKSKTTSDKAN